MKLQKVLLKKAIMHCMSSQHMDLAALAAKSGYSVHEAEQFTEGSWKGNTWGYVTFHEQNIRDFFEALTGEETVQPLQDVVDGFIKDYTPAKPVVKRQKKADAEKVDKDEFARRLGEYITRRGISPDRYHTVAQNIPLDRRNDVANTLGVQMEIFGDMLNATAGVNILLGEYAAIAEYCEFQLPLQSDIGLAMKRAKWQPFGLKNRKKPESDEQVR